MKTLKADSPAIILMHPQMGENIGAAARAMANFGLSDLRLVAPRDGWPNESALTMSANAFAYMPPPQVFDSLEEAVADLHYIYATTARPRDMVKPVHTPRYAVQDGHSRIAQKQKIGFVFGRERTGLENDDIALCQAIVTSPTAPNFSSLNLGQCVLLVAYEWMMTSDKTPELICAPNDSIPVSQDKLEELFVRLEAELEAGHFFRSKGLEPTMKRNIRGMFTRAEFTEQEACTFHGMISALIGKKSPR